MCSWKANNTQKLKILFQNVFKYPKKFWQNNPNNKSRKKLFIVIFIAVFSLMLRWFNEENLWRRFTALRCGTGRRLCSQRGDIGMERGQWIEIAYTLTHFLGSFCGLIIEVGDVRPVLFWESCGMFEWVFGNIKQ